MSFHQLNSKNNVLVLLVKTVLRHRNGFLSSVATDCKDGHGLKNSFNQCFLMITLQGRFVYR